MVVTTRPTLSIAMVMQSIRQCADLSAKRKGEICSALKRLCEVTQTDPHSTLADPGTLRRLFGSGKWRQVGLSKGSWANIRSLATEGLKIAGVRVHRSRANYPLLPSWEVIFDHGTERDRVDLRRFAGWCSTFQIVPSAVDQKVFEQFLAYCTQQMTHRDPRARWQVARRCWNSVVQRGLVPGAAKIEAPSAPGWRAMAWRDFPPSLLSDFARYAGARTSSKKIALRPQKPLKPVTVKNYETRLRILASCVVETGVSAESLTNLAVLLRPDHVQAGLEQHMRGDDGDQSRARLAATGVAIRAVATWLHGQGELPEEVYKEIVALCRVVEYRPSGMCDKNRRRLEQFKSPSAVRTLLTLPEEIFRRLAAMPVATVRHAQDAQMAALLALLVHAPVRIRNASELDLDKHILRQGAGDELRWVLHWTDVEVKNHVSLDHVLPPRCSRLLELYLTRYRPLLVKTPTSRLFIGQTGMAKSSHLLGDQLAQFVSRHTGLEIHVHLIRHLMAYLYLKSHPGDYVTVQRLLGHKSLQMTLNFYTGFETDADHERLDRVIARLTNDGAGTGEASWDRL